MGEGGGQRGEGEEGWRTGGVEDRRSEVGERRGEGWRREGVRAEDTRG